MNVLAQYGPAVAGLRWVPVEGGLSGALVWRGEDTAPVFALKAHPPGVTVEHITQVHARMRQAAHLPFVPAIIPTTHQTTTAAADGRVWELVRWVPGEPGLTTPARITNAAVALADLHRAWSPPKPHFAPCPGILRRLAALRSGAHPPLIHAAVRALLPWAERPVPVQPCLCDVHADHVLFAGDAVTGVIDLAATQTDHVAVDLARLFGELADEPLAAAVDEYRARSGTPVATDFVLLLARTGLLAAHAVWSRRFAAAPPSPRQADRFRHLVRRISALTPSHFMVSA